MHRSINNPRAFFHEVVVPDCQDFLQARDNVRLAFHACASIHHLKDWLYSSGQVTGYTAKSDFETDLNARCPALRKLRELAVNAKHFQPQSAEVMEVGVSAKSLGYGWAQYGMGQFGRGAAQDQVVAKTEAGESNWVVPLIQEALVFWQNEFEVKGW